MPPSKSYQLISGAAAVLDTLLKLEVILPPYAYIKKISKPKSKYWMIIHIFIIIDMPKKVKRPEAYLK